MTTPAMRAGPGDEQPQVGREAAEERERRGQQHRQRLPRRAVDGREVEVQDLPPPDDPGPRVVGRGRRREEAQRGEREDRRSPRGSARRRAARRAPARGDWVLSARAQGAWSGDGRLWRTPMLPAVKTMQASRAQLRARAIPLQDHDSPLRRARLAAGPRRSPRRRWPIRRGRPPGNLSAPHLFVDPVDVTASGDGTALAWWAWQDGTGTAARTGRSLASRPPGATAFGAQRSAPSGTVGRRGLRADAGHRADRPSARPDLIGPHPPVRRVRRHQRQFGSRSASSPRPDRRDRPVLAVNANGDAAIAYFQHRGARTTA